MLDLVQGEGLPSPPTPLPLDTFLDPFSDASKKRCQKHIPSALSQRQVAKNTYPKPGPPEGHLKGTFPAFPKNLEVFQSQSHAPQTFPAGLHEGAALCNKSYVTFYIPTLTLGPNNWTLTNSWSNPSTLGRTSSQNPLRGIVVYPIPLTPFPCTTPCQPYAQKHVKTRTYCKNMRFAKRL